MTATFPMMTRDAFLAQGAYATARADDNSGTFVLNKDGEALGFVPNTAHADGLWLYYSSDVRNWLGIAEHRGWMDARDAKRYAADPRPWHADEFKRD